MIDVVNLVKRYGDFTALHGITFHVPKGQILGLLGPNGAGKSTTMKILSCFMPATSGEAKVAGFDVFDDPFEVKKRVGYLPEHPPLYLEMRVKEYLEYVADLKQLERSRIKGRLDFVAEHCGLKDNLHSVIGTLSKGFRQRVGIAQALIHDPEVVILDEPTVGLDPVQIVEIRNLIKGLAKSHTVILSTHILPEVVMTCDRVILVNRGKILADGSVSSLAQGSGESLEQAYLRIIANDEHVAPLPAGASV
ncbi:MAG: ATP-binding cassette domain-containing protein [Bdellovibrionales bacterium]|nr:ATP-binding cassette domain-containing protein [Bdellovibrionales bacterium]